LQTLKIVISTSSNQWLWSTVFKKQYMVLHKIGIVCITFWHIYIMFMPPQPFYQLLSKTMLVRQFNVTGNNKMYLGLHVMCSTFLPHINQVSNFYTDCHIIFPYQMSRKSVQREPHMDRRTAWRHFSQREYFNIASNSKMYEVLHFKCLIFLHNFNQIWIFFYTFSNKATSGYQLIDRCLIYKIHVSWESVS